MSAHMPPPPPSTTGTSPGHLSAPVDCQPVLKADASNVWVGVETEMQRMELAVKTICATLGIDAYVARSNTFEFANVVTFEAWIPTNGDPHLTERVWANFWIQPKPWHKFPMEYTVKVHNRGREESLGVYDAMPDSRILTILTYLMQGGVKPTFAPQLREPHHKFFMKLRTVVNKPVGVKSDAATTFAVFLAIASVGAFFIAGNLPGDSAGPLVVGGIVGLLISVVILVVRGKRSFAVRSTGRPDYQPRVLRVYDSWQVVLFGAGPSRDLFYERFLEVLRNAPIPDMKAEIEPVAYRVLGELVSREQIVLSARRGVIYCQIYPFGNDLYVGWQSFLNRGRWNEYVISQGIDKITGRNVKFQSVTPGWENLCEYDYADTNCLTEWTHAQMVALIKQLVAELKIDQEIDFQIVRGDRPGADVPQQQQEKKSGFFKRKH
jgi:hypothetical protein